MTKYSIREVDGPDEEETIRWLNELVDVSFPYITDAELEYGYWWLAYRDNNPVAFAGLIATRDDPRTGYFKRAGVHPKHRGHGLQIRLMRVRERKARKMGWNCIVSESTGTAYSANNFIRAKFSIYEPESPWAFPQSIYWIKKLG